MRLSLFALIVIFSAGMIMAQGGKGEKYVSPKGSNVGLYQNETRKVYEEPIKKLSTEDRLLILKDGRFNYQVQHSDGTRGWIEKDKVVATGKSKTFIFDNADVFGYLDNPTPVYIIDADDPNADPISLDRSFKDALRENVDRETVERQVN